MYVRIHRDQIKSTTTLNNNKQEQFIIIERIKDCVIEFQPIHESRSENFQLSLLTRRDQMVDLRVLEATRAAVL